MENKIKIIKKTDCFGNVTATLTVPLKMSDAYEKEINRFGIAPFEVPRQSYMGGFRRWDNLPIAVADPNNEFNNMGQIRRNADFINSMGQ